MIFRECNLFLGTHQRSVFPVLRHQRWMTPLLDDFFPVNYGDTIRIADGGQTVRNDDGGAAFAQAVKEAWILASVTLSQRAGCFI